MATDLEALLQQKKDEQAQAAQDAESEKERWLADIRSLYADVESWLAPLREKEYLKFVYNQVQLQESGVGSYKAPVLRIEFFNGQRIRLEPKGRYIIGAAGRIDFVVGKRTYYLIRQPKSFEWLVVVPDTSPPETSPFGKEVFEAIVEEFVAAF